MREPDPKLLSKFLIALAANAILFLSAIALWWCSMALWVWWTD